LILISGESILLLREEKYKVKVSVLHSGLILIIKWLGDSAVNSSGVQ